MTRRTDFLHVDLSRSARMRGYPLLAGALMIWIYAAPQGGDANEGVGQRNSSQSAAGNVVTGVAHPLSRDVPYEPVWGVSRDGLKTFSCMVPGEGIERFCIVMVR